MQRWVSCPQEPPCTADGLPQSSVHGLAGHSDLRPPLSRRADTGKPAECPHFLLPVNPAPEE